MSWKYEHKKYKGETIVRNGIDVCGCHLLESLCLGCRYMVKDTDSRLGRLISVRNKNIWVSNTLFKKYF